MNFKQTTLLLFLLAIGLCGCRPSGTSVVPVHLRTEYLENPLGIGTRSPRFT